MLLPKVMNEYFDRTERLIGPNAMSRLGEVRVIIFGVGGVGSWAAETLVRTGVRHITLIDADRVAISNINRQVPALSSTVGEVKVEVMRDRLLEINPELEIEVIHGLYTSETASGYNLTAWDYVIDAIDSLADKALLILKATEAMSDSSRTSHPMKFYSSMGAALKLDPARIAVAEFWNVRGCPLAAALRRRFKKSGQFPSKKFLCVYSDELLPNHPSYSENREDTAMSYGKKVTNGSLMHITAIFGITLASLVIRDVVRVK